MNEIAVTVKASSALAGTPPQTVTRSFLKDSAIGAVFAWLQEPPHLFPAGSLIDLATRKPISLTTVSSMATLRQLGLDSHPRLSLIFESHANTGDTGDTGDTGKTCDTDVVIVDDLWQHQDKFGSLSNSLIDLYILTPSRVLVRSFGSDLSVSNVLTWLQTKGVNSCHHGGILETLDGRPLPPSMTLQHLDQTCIRFRPVLTLYLGTVAARTCMRVLVRGFNDEGAMANRFPRSAPLGLVYMWLHRTSPATTMVTGRLARSYPRCDLPRATHPDSYLSLAELGLDEKSETLLWVDDAKVKARIRAAMVDLEEQRATKDEEARRREKERLAVERSKKQYHERIESVRREIEEDRMKRIAKRQGSALAEMDKPSISPRALLTEAGNMAPRDLPSASTAAVLSLADTPVRKTVYTPPTPAAATASSASSLLNRPHDHQHSSAQTANVTTLRILGNARIQRRIKPQFNNQDPQFPTRTTALRDVFEWIRREVGPVDDAFELWLHSPPGERGARELREERQGHYTLEELGLGVAARVWYQRV